MKVNNLLFLAGFLSTMYSGFSTHILGGYAQCSFMDSTVNSARYHIQVYLYRDAKEDFNPSRNVSFDKTLMFCVFDGNSMLNPIDVHLRESKNVTPGISNCYTPAINVFELGYYSDTITLQKSKNSYHLFWERCCRKDFTNFYNSTPSVPSQGMRLSCTIPPWPVRNQAPQFLNAPILFLCQNDTGKFYFQAQDADLDSISYRLVTSFAGASDVDPLPNCPGTWKIPVEATYLAGYSANELFGVNGYSSLDSASGLLTYYSKAGGTFAQTLEVLEWRNQTIINVTRVDLTAWVQWPLGTNAKERTALHIFPNPANSFINISGLPGQPFAWYLRNELGQQIKFGRGSGDLTIPTENLPDGVYYFITKTSQQVVTSKIIIMREN